MAILKTKQVHFLIIDGKDVPLSEHDVDQLRRDLIAAERDWRVPALHGMKIDAIKMVRGLLGLGLKEAKDVVELFLSEQGTDIDSARRLLSRVTGHYDDQPDPNDDIPF